MYSRCWMSCATRSNRSSVVASGIPCTIMDRGRERLASGSAARVSRRAFLSAKGRFGRITAELPICVRKAEAFRMTVSTEL